MDLREFAENPEEVLRVVFAGFMKSRFTIMPVRVTEDTKDGHVAVVQPTIKRAITDPQTGQLTYEDHPVHPDVPITHATGGGVTSTFPVKVGDTGMALYASRAIDTWFQSDDTQQPIDDRQHSLSDAFYVPGPRSVPRALKQVEKDSHQTRSDDKKHVVDLHPETGVHVKSVDPSEPPASDEHDPFRDAKKFYEHHVNQDRGVQGNATDGDQTHSHGVEHDTGAYMKAANGLHTVLADPTAGASMNALNGLHSVLAHPSLGALLSGGHGSSTVKADSSGVNLQSATSIGMSAPSISMPAGSLGGGALAGASVDSSKLAAGSAAGNVGALGGDLGGTLPNPAVLNILNVAGANALRVAANDAAAAALVPPVPVGGLYRNGSVLMVRVA